ncbi:transglutaminase-like cysteine peptidase [Microvirga sp. BT689]|uniref:transglutaminase-like cysteine peptidase n=1 Tax=Microvirga arvi TaxID=2778731 RepID=UPI0019525F39|nr:transglutaminase-like cysteine peptidase [Microvirga arvi]MBM6581236.1 transglutaminase-like cysteine peptidase [Microvirga arvi]
MERCHRSGLTTPDKGRATRRAMKVGLLLATLMVGYGAEPASATSLSAFVNQTLQPAGWAGPTPAWIEFCQRQPQECAVDLSEPDMIALDQQTWDTIVQINEEVNGTILSVADQDHWGVVDRWDYPDDGLGDCEDIQLLKRKLLVEAGLPRRALRMTVAIDEQGAGHAVLMVRSDFGDFILDNKKDAVLSWQETGYGYVKREGSDSLDWVWLGDQTALVVTANR